MECSKSVKITPDFLFSLYVSWQYRYKEMCTYTLDINYKHVTIKKTKSLTNLDVPIPNVVLSSIITHIINVAITVLFFTLS